MYKTPYHFRGKNLSRFLRKALTYSALHRFQKVHFSPKSGKNREFLQMTGKMNRVNANPARAGLFPQRTLSSWLRTPSPSGRIPP